MDLFDYVFWTDSSSVLKYIKNEMSRFKVFVANRVSQILKASCPTQWRYVDTASNPAHIASRGVKVDVYFRTLHGCQDLTFFYILRVSGLLIMKTSTIFCLKTPRLNGWLQ